MVRGNTCRFLLIRAYTIKALSTADHRPLCVVRRLEWKKKEAPGARWEVKRKRRGPFPSSYRPPRAFYFSFIAIFIVRPSGSLWGGESHRGVKSNMDTDIGEFKIRLRLRPDFLDKWWQRKRKLWEWIRLKNCGNIPEKVWEGKMTRICEHSGNPSGQNGISRVSPAKKVLVIVIW